MATLRVLTAPSHNAPSPVGDSCPCGLMQPFLLAGPEAPSLEQVRAFFDEYIRMYASRDERLTAHFSENFSGFTGGGDFLVKDKAQWVDITRQDFAQVKNPIRIEHRDVFFQVLDASVAVATGFFRIHLPFEEHILSRETARLVLIFRREDLGWRISHSSISIPYPLVRAGEVYPMLELVERNKELEILAAERTRQLSEANAQLHKVNESLEREIVGHKLAEAENRKLEAHNLQLQKAESLGRMAGAVAHHFNNELHAVLMGMELAIEELPEGAMASESLRLAMDSARKAAEVSNLMLTYLGQMTVPRQALDLVRTCSEALPALIALLPQGLRIETNFQGAMPTLPADPEQVQRILANLVTNAWEAYGDCTGVIRISLFTAPAECIPLQRRFPVDFRPKDTSYVCLSVEDCGCGIPEGVFSTLFDPFYSSKFPGRGMGLAVVLGIARSMDGVVTVQSEVGKGSTFRVFVPVQA